ncbi:MAG: hypothetical protein ABI123_04180 [Ginsengibacter sp.]
MKYFNHQNYQFTFSGIARGMFFMSFLICFLGTNAQKIEIISNTSNISYRGLSVVNDNVIWVSGNKGTIQRSIDGGKTFHKIQVKGFEKNDFRDIQAFDSNTAVIMAINEPALILRTENGGKDWKTVFSNTTKGMFLDAMDFNANNGVVIGDPIDGHFFWLPLMIRAKIGREFLRKCDQWQIPEKHVLQVVVQISEYTT